MRSSKFKSRNNFRISTIGYLHYKINYAVIHGVLRLLLLYVYIVYIYIYEDPIMKREDSLQRFLHRLKQKKLIK